MKAPRLDLRAMGGFLARHGEKIIVASIGLMALVLVWEGLRAKQSLSATEKLSADAVNRAAMQARGHIDRAAAPPADLLPPREPLVDILDTWRSPLVPWIPGAKPSRTIVAQPVATVLDKPLFDELQKRSKPSVFPLKDVQAVAGLAVMPAAGPAAGGAAQQAPKPRRADRRPPPGGDPLAAGAEAPADQNAQGDVATRGRIVPYVIVTGLIPVAEQQAEYRQRFEGCGLRDPKRDSPKWRDFEIDRGTMSPDGKETWTRIDLVTVAAQRGKELGATDVDREFLLGEDADLRNKATTPIPFCSALPERTDGSWDLAGLHPWIVDQLAEKRKAAEKTEPPAGGDTAPAGPGTDGPGFDVAEERPPQPEAPQPVEAKEPDYRLFRFIDTEVRPGGTYRYRVRLKVWNPNYSKDPERMRPHLVDPALAHDEAIAAPDSKPSTTVTVPDTTRILVGALRRDDMKELKIRPGSGIIEVLVIAPSAKAGQFSLRALVADAGAVIDVDEALNAKNQRDRARGEKLVTGRLLIDARGRQEDREEEPAEKGKQPDAIPEPLEVLCLRPDGSFELASLDGSEQSLAAHRDTLPPRSAKPDAKAAAPADALRGAVPAEDPLARPGAGK